MTDPKNPMSLEKSEKSLHSNSDTRGRPAPLSQILTHAEETGQSLVNAGRTLAAQAVRDIDQRGLAGGVIAMSAGEVVGSALGGVLGSVAGPGGAVVGAQLGGFAGSSLGARYGYDCAAALTETGPTVPPGEILARRGSERLGEVVGEAGGTALGALMGGTETEAVLGAIGERMGGSLGEHAQNGMNTDLPDPANRPRSYRQAPTRAWFKRVIKEHLADSALSGALGFAGGLIGGTFGRTLGQRAGLVASSRLQWGRPNEPEFVDPDKPESPPVAMQARDKINTSDAAQETMADEPG